MHRHSSLTIETTEKLLHCTQTLICFFPILLHQLLDRHLVLNEAYSIEDLANKTEIKTLRGQIKIRVEGAKVFLEWEGIHAHIERPNINAINGVIHAIDKILFKESDMKVSEEEARLSAASMAQVGQLFILLTVLVGLLLNRFN